LIAQQHKSASDMRRLLTDDKVLAKVAGILFIQEANERLIAAACQNMKKMAMLLCGQRSGGKGLPDHNMVSTIADRPQIEGLFIDDLQITPAFGEG